MNDPLDRVRELAAQARQEAPPSGRVASAVLVRLRDMTEDIARPLTVFAAITAGLTVAALWLAMVSAPAATTNPLDSFFNVVSMTGI